MQSSSIFGDVLCTLHSVFPDDPTKDYYEKGIKMFNLKNSYNKY